MTTDISRVGVSGAGTMGNGIAQVIAASGVTVVMTDISDEAANRGLDTIAKNLDRLVSRQKLSAADKDATLARIKTADIDTVMKPGMAHPMGPLALADLMGLDTWLSILQVLYDGFKDPKYRPCPLWREKLDAGHLGRKSGHGFFDYSRK